MNDLSAFERQLGAVLRSAAGPSRPTDVAALVHTATTPAPKWRFQSMFSAAKFLVAGAIVALFGSFLLSGVLTQQPSDEPLPPAAAPGSVSPEVTAEVTTEPEQVTVDASVDPRLAGNGPWLSLESSSERRDMLMAAEREGLLPRRYTEYEGSPTGLAEPWPTRWQSDGFGFRAAMSSTDIDDRPRLRVVVEGPDGELLRQRLGKQESPFSRLRSWGSAATPAIVISGTGILMRGEHEGDVVRTWYSADGERWTERRSWLRDDEMIGTPEGFIRVRDERLHHSTDGSDWSRVPGTYPGAVYLGERDGEQVFGYWSDDGPRVGRLTEAGIEVFPYSIEAFGSERPDRGTRGDAVAGWNVWGGFEPDEELGALPPSLLTERRFSVVGSLGIVHLDPWNRTIVFTRDGTSWSAIAMPEDWLPLSLTPPPGAFASGAGATLTWVTEDSVIISASVAEPGVGDEQLTERTFRGTLVAPPAAQGGEPYSVTPEAVAAIEK